MHWMGMWRRGQADTPEGTPPVPCGPGTLPGTEMASSSKTSSALCTQEGQKRRKTRRADKSGRGTGRKKEAQTTQRRREK